MNTHRIRRAHSPPCIAPAIMPAAATQPLGSVRIVGGTDSGKSVIARAVVCAQAGSHRPFILSPLSALPV